MVKDKKQQRRRVAKEDVRNNARESGGGKKYFNLPKGVDMWEPDKAGSFLLDIIPYEIKTDVHPDRRGDKIIPGDIWWKFPFAVHQNIGPGNEEVVCPASFGKPCPICEERAALAKNYDDNKEAIKAINAKKHAAYVIKNPDDDGKYSVFAYSTFKFGDPLDEELKTGGDEVLSFYDVTDEGKTLKVRFSEEEYMGRKFLKATRIDFNEREAMDEDEVLNAVPCLDEIFVVMEYEDLKKLFLQIPSDEQVGKPGKSKTTAPAPKGASTKKADKKEPEPKFEDGDRVQFTLKGKIITGEVTDVDGETISIKTDDGKEHDVEADDVEVADEDETEASATDSDFTIGATVKDEKGRIGIITKIGTGKQKDDITWKDTKGKETTTDIADLEVVGEVEPPDGEDSNTEQAPLAIGDKVKTDNGKEGVVLKIDKDDVTIKTSAGKVVVDVDDLEWVTEETEGEAPEKVPDEESYTPAAGDNVKFTNSDGEDIVGKILKIDANDDATVKDAAGKKHVVDVDDLERVEEEPGEATEGEEVPTFTVGDLVEWDEGSESGQITKIHSSGEKAKVKNGDAETWVPIAELTKAKPAKQTGKKK